MSWTERYVSVAGGGAHDGTSEANAWTLAEALAAYAGGERVNVIAGTYTAASRNWNLAGTASSGSWWRGYNAAIGDIDADNSLAKPAIQAGTNTQTFSGAHHLFTNLDFSGNPAGTLLTVTGTHVHFDRVRGENTDSGGTSYLLRVSGNGFLMTRSWLKAHASASYVGILEEGGAFDHVHFRGGVAGLLLDIGTRGGAVCFCIFDDQAAGVGIQANAGASQGYVIVNNTVYGAGSHGIQLSATQPAWSLVRGNILVTNGAYGLGLASGGPLRIGRLANDFYNNTSGTETGMGDWPSLAEQTESADPFVNAASHDFTPKSTANAIGTGAGGEFENS